MSSGLSPGGPRPPQDQDVKVGRLGSFLLVMTPRCSYRGALSPGAVSARWRYGGE